MHNLERRLFDYALSFLIANLDEDLKEEIQERFHEEIVHLGLAYRRDLDVEEFLSNFLGGEA